MKSLAPYRHELGVLQAVIEANKYPAQFRCDSAKAAIAWRSRAYKAITIMRKVDAERNGVPLEEGTSPFDNLRLTLRDEVVIIDERLVEGILVIGGDAVDVAPYFPAGDAAQLDLGLDLDFSDIDQLIKEDN